MCSIPRFRVNWNIPSVEQICACQKGGYTSIGVADYALRQYLDARARMREAQKPEQHAEGSGTEAPQPVSCTQHQTPTNEGS